MAKKRDTSHIICKDATHGEEAYQAECLHCGASWKPSEMPIEVGKYLKESRRFIRAHRDCPKPQEDGHAE